MDKLRNENKDLRSLAYKILVEKFNNKYKSLLPEQKNVLKEYINNISNTNGLNEFMESKFKSISYNLKKVFPKISNKVVKIKIKECINLIENVNTKDTVQFIGQTRFRRKLAGKIYVGNFVGNGLASSAW